MSSKLSYLSLECLKNAIQKDGVASLFFTFSRKNVAVTTTELELPSSADSDIDANVDSDVNSDLGSVVDSDGDSGVESLLSYHNPYIDPCDNSSVLPPYTEPFARTFPLLPEKGIFEPIALYSKSKRSFVPISGDESSSLPYLHDSTVNIVQLLVPPTMEVFPCSVSRLPLELLSLILQFVTIFQGDDHFDGYSAGSILSQVCKLWRTIALPYWGEPASAAEAYARLAFYPGAGRMWKRLHFKERVSIEVVKVVIEGSPNVTEVELNAFWDEEEAKIVLKAIRSLKLLDDIIFGDEGSRKWRKEEVENFMQRKRKIVALEASDVEDSSPSSPLSASAGLRLRSGLIDLSLRKYPPLPSLSLPRTLENLILSHLCPLPPSVSANPLPPFLEQLTVELAPFSSSGKTSILPTPLDLSRLTQLTQLFLDGGEEDSNLVPYRFFSALKAATTIREITLMFVYSLASGSRKRSM
ncbi:hypothetical protein BT69DRAFT_1348715 [Atractiella rhizophila]|nr:hypothetical protein BT69DRAFT_1348715 [Atractiella rhizophila]